jgi:hypothetical protein
MTTTNTTPTGTEAGIDLDKLEALAHAATPGPWFRVNHPGGAWTLQTKPTGAGLCIAQQYAGSPDEVADFIAAANPAAILALIALARRAAPLAHPIGQDDWKLVPVESTGAMDSAGQDALLAGGLNAERHDAEACYLAMLAAAPVAPSSTDSAQAAVEEVRTDAARDVLAERRRQVEAEGWTLEGDDQYDGGELSLAAACYALAGDPPYASVPADWPWDYGWWKPVDDRRNLVKAAALILADIERIDRSTAAQAATKGDKS